MRLNESQKRGALATVVFHTAVLLTFLFFGFIAPFPPPPEEGILLDFGNSETGVGMEEPSAAQGAEQQITKIKNTSAPKTISKPQTINKKDKIDEENLLTQDYEKTIALNSSVKKKIIDAKKVKLDEERKLNEQFERQKRFEELEAKRLAEAEQVKTEETAKKIGSISSRAKNAFGGGMTDNGSQSTGQGITYGPGNQGSPDGTPGANQYGLGGGSGKGAGNGPSFNLLGRSAQSMPKPSFPGNEAGIVVVEVTVDKFGKVTKALPGIKGSNTIDSDLLEAAKKAALTARFNSDTNAPAFQKGTITYHFVLQ